MCSWFAPTNFVITFETKGVGKFTQEELEKLVEKDSKGNVQLNLPTKSVLITNHQVCKVRLYCLIQSSDILMTAKNVDICGLVVSLAPSQVLCFVPTHILCQVCVVSYVLHEHASGRIHRAEEVP